ncbi:phospho-sugar mutase [Agromyces aerolatus]|uniref:phospho-sugar mutase n=1 Tax=Agromyces sp. LY-1074 TaxID=3074080 RepID=UPI00285B3108|nr:MULTISPECIES: phospho-sugar mutase [unclassified Agromyces]MDR5700335.1 phospho-sugar mutase [Agromyces sp. LY-1074]MDR5706687.1 phospho-sugar mutase [Agromyces sp. LY-1358]
MAEVQLSEDDAQRIALAESWIAQDPDPETRDELAGLIESGRSGDRAALAELAERFDRRLEFGTAGLRGEIAAGPNRMNRVLVAQAAAGLAAYLVEHARPGATPSVVIGYDGRKNSAVFARDSAEIMAGAGVRAILLPRLLPTPVLAFAVRHLEASAGVMVTASHNPPNDNGYKVYLGGEHGGSQIVAPADAEIAAHIQRVADGTTVPELPRGEFETAPESIVDDYVRETAQLASHAGAAARHQPSTVYTAMHGVGWETFARVLETAGFAPPALVDAQIAPDPAFPTVSFPNPEEPGAMDLAFARAREVGAELIIANDPDADRLAVAIPDPTSEVGYRRLTGNEVGLLLGWRAAELAAGPDGGGDGTLACSIVSSPGLQTVAEAYGLDFRATLTGFKWISRAPGIVYGFEEALGYLVNAHTVRDKDGISAALAFLDLATGLKAEGRTVAEHLDAFVERFGCFASTQISIRVTDLSRIAAVMTRLRTHPPATLGTSRVERIDDLADGFDDLPPSDVLRIVVEGGSRVTVRPSGTEPKLKIYIDAVSAAGSVAERRSAASATVIALEAALRTLVA